MADITQMDPSVKQREYLEQRAFKTTPSQIEKAQIEFCGTSKAYELLGKTKPSGDNRQAIIFYFPGSTYVQVRWMGDSYSGGWGQREGCKCEGIKGRDVEAYLPALCDWNAYGKTPRKLYLCESPLKALVMSARGHFAVGGAGVWGLYNKHNFVRNFPHHLFDSEITDSCEILFDSDWSRNIHVRGAIRTLGNATKERFPNVPIHHRALPDPPVGTKWWEDKKGSGKWGIDDAIEYHGEEWLSQFLSNDTSYLQEITTSILQQNIDELSEQYAIVKSPPGIVHFDQGRIIKRNEFILLEANRTAFVDNNGRPKAVSIAEEWIKSEERTIVNNLVYKPGAKRVEQGDYFNIWQDSGATPVDGDIEPFLKVYRNAIPDEKIRRLLIESLAWIMQNRGERLEKSFMLVGSQVGTGKSLLVKILGKCVGASNFIEMGEEDFTSDYNSFFTAKEVVLLDDVVKLTKSHEGKLRRFVTGDTIVVNPKGVQQYQLDNMGVYFLTANEWGSLRLSDQERRTLLVHFDPIKHYETGHKWWHDFFHWLDVQDGYGIVRHFLETLDISDYNPMFYPPMSEAKQHMVETSRSPEEQWLLQLYSNPNDVLPENLEGRSVFSTSELYALYSGGAYAEMNRSGQVVWGRALGDKFFKANGGKPIRCGGKPQPYWKIRNRHNIWDSKAVNNDVKNYSGKY